MEKEEIQYYINMVRSNPNIIEYVPEEVLIEHPEICMDAVKQSALALRYVPK